MDSHSAPPIVAPASRWTRAGALLAVNLLFLMIWGFSGIGTNGTAQQFAYFTGTLVALMFVGGAGPQSSVPDSSSP